MSRPVPVFPAGSAGRKRRQDDFRPSGQNSRFSDMAMGRQGQLLAGPGQGEPWARDSGCFHVAWGGRKGRHFIGRVSG